VVVIPAEVTLSARWVPGTAKAPFLMLLQGVVPATLVTVSADLATLLSRAVLSVSLPGSDVDLSLPFRLKKALVRETEAVPVLPPMSRVTAATLSEATVAILLLGASPVKVVLSVLNALSDPSEPLLLPRRTCSGATECVLTPPSLPHPILAPLLHPPFPTHPPRRVDVLA
jgi:hypothetical protein